MQHYRNLKFQNMHAKYVRKTSNKSIDVTFFATTSHKKDKMKIFKNEFKTSIFSLSMMCSEHEK